MTEKKVIEDLKADTISIVVKEHVDSLAELTTDNATPYSKLADHVKSHHAQVIKPEELPRFYLEYTLPLAMLNDCCRMYTIN